MAEHVQARLDEFSGDQLGKTLHAFGSMQVLDTERGGDKRAEGYIWRSRQLHARGASQWLPAPTLCYPPLLCAQYYDDDLLEGVVAHVMANPDKFSAGEMGLATPWAPTRSDAQTARRWWRGRPATCRQPGGDSALQHQA